MQVGPLLILEALVSAGRSEMHGEGVAGKTYGDGIVSGDVNGRRARRADALNRYLFRSQHDIVLVRLTDHGIDQILVCLVHITAADHGDVFQIVLEREVAHLHWNDLESAIDQAYDSKKSDDSFDCSHVPRNLTLPGELGYFIPLARAIPDNIQQSPQS